MKHPRIINFLILLLVIACSTNNYQHRIAVFEKTLGEKKARALSEVVEEFELKLLDYYQTTDLEEAYHSYFREMSEANYDFAHSFGLKRMREITDTFRQIQLEQEIILKPYDIISYKGNLVPIYLYTHESGKVDTIDPTKDTTIVPVKRLDPTLLTDSLKSIKMQRIEYNTDGKYFQALEKIKDNDSIIVHYLEGAYETGIMSEPMEAHFFLSIDAEINDYFVKRMILLSLIY